MREINTIFRQNPQKSWGGALKKPVKIFIASLLVLCILCTAPSLAIDSTAKATLKTYFGNPSVSNSDVVTADSGEVLLANADALKVDMGNGINLAQDKSYDFQSKTFGRVFVMVADAHTVDGILSGIKICPIQIDGVARRAYDGDPDNSDSTSGGTRRRVCRLYEKTPSGTDNEKCRWLCTNGYTGTECTIAVNNFQNNYGTDDLSWNNVSVKKAYTDDSSALAVNFGSHYYNDYSGSVNHYNLAKMYLLATKTVSNGVVVQPVAISVKVGHEVQISDNNTVPRYKTRETQKVFCIPGYKPNSNNTGCDQIPTNPCYGASTFRVPFTYGTGSYVYNGALNCSYDSVNNKWCKMPNGGSTKCAGGYYGNPSMITISSTCGWASSGCSSCPSPGTSSEGATKITQCYRSAQSGTKCDDIGCYTETGTCYYEQ